MLDSAPGDIDVVTFVHVARFDAVKDHETLLAAWSIVQASRPSAQLICVGRGTDSSKFKDLQAKHGVLFSVTGVGEWHDMPRCYESADVLVLSSITESSPIVVAEALACGLPIVATDVGDIATVAGTCGLIVPPKSPRDLARAMLTAASNKSFQEMAAQDGVLRAKELFAPDKFAAAWNDVLATPADAPTVSLTGFAKRALQSFKALLWEAVPPVRAWLMALCAFGLSAVTTHIIAPAIPTYGYLAWIKNQVEWSGVILWAFGLWPILGHVYNTIIGGVVDKTINTLKATSK
jgi:hypothetical protein